VESGYSLIEVVASIIILTIAILPMAGMFDMALKTATASSNYDKARTLANLKMEEAKSLPFNSTDASVQDVKDNFPEAAGTTTAYTNGVYETPTWKTVTGPASAAFNNSAGEPLFHYKIKKQYMEQPTASSVQFNTSPTETTLIRVNVIVGWGTYNSGSDTYSKTYATFGLVTL
jgi:Tfp pilus assembly protein PilV